MKMALRRVFCSCMLLIAGIAADDVVNLPFGDINVMMVTDVHSWISGHKHEPNYDASYGDVLSLHQRLKADCDRNQRDLFFVMNGDFNDGTGLSTDPPVELTPLLERMPWDAVTTGNHEMYKNDFIDYISKDDGFVKFWGDRYLTSNVVKASTGTPLGRTHKFLRGTFGTTLLTFGFLYNMPDHGTNVNVLKVEEVVQQQWFRDALSGKEESFDAVLILGHMDYADPLVSVILQAVRSVQPRVPVQFVTGHSHMRKYAALDAAASSFEAGHYLDTVGFASFPKNRSTSNAMNGNSTLLAETPGFQHVFIDASKAAFGKVLNLDDFATPEGLAFSKAIVETRKSMGLSQRLGCAPKKYELCADFTRGDCLWKVFMDEVMPATVFKGTSSKVFLQNTESLRYSLFAGNVTKDDVVTMSPFHDQFWMLSRKMSGSAVKSLLAKLNAASNSAANRNAFVSTLFEESGTYDLYGGSFDVGSVEKPGQLLEALNSLSSAPVLPELQYIGKTTTGLWYDFLPAAWPCQHDVSSLESLLIEYV